jgi:glycosyltransferase involved in cell wall biosynthesis
MRLVAVLWSGAIGGAETFTVDLCGAMRDVGADPTVLFVAQSEPLSARLDAAGIRHSSLGLSRGRKVILHPRALAGATKELGPDGALLPSGGYLPASLRAGGYRSRVIVVGHDAALGSGRSSARDRLKRQLDWASGFWASDIDVAGSEFALTQLRARPRRGSLVRIPFGIDLDFYLANPRIANGESLTVGYAGRLIEGKGVDVLLRALAVANDRARLRLQIAGNGPALPMLQDLATELGLDGVVEFVGWSLDIPSFWSGCDIAVMPSSQVVESFGLAAVEAMACSRPVVATESGALPELIEDGVSGLIVAPGDIEGLAGALISLSLDPARRSAMGAAGRARCERLFDIRDCAASYLRLFG